MSRKFNRHGHIDKSVRGWIQKISKNEHVEKVILGGAENIKHRYRPGTIKFQKTIPAGLVFKTYTSNGIRQILIYCSEGLKIKLKGELIT